MAYSPRTKYKCIELLEAIYSRKLTSKEKRKTYKELYVWYKTKQRGV